MQKINMDEKELYDLIERAVRDVLQEEMFRHRLENLPSVSDEEMRDIEGAYGKPTTLSRQKVFRAK